MNNHLRWIEFAREDFVLAESALEKQIFNQVCFHVQQGIEKTLKAFLSSKGRKIPRIHSLAELISICVDSDDSFKEFEDMCIRLDQYYIPTRYPDALPGMGPEGLPTKNDAEEAFNSLKEIMHRIKSKFN